MKSDHPEPWLDELLSDHEIDELRAARLDQGLAVVRRRRQLRRRVRASGVIVSLLSAVVVLVVLFETASPAREKPLTSDPRRPANESRPGFAGDHSESGDVSRLSDDELLAMFPGRPVALIGPAGRQKLVFLDQLRVGSSP